MTNPHSSASGPAKPPPLRPVRSGLDDAGAHRIRAPAVAQYSLGVQHELKPSVIWVVQYVGNMAWHQNDQRHIDNFSLDTPMYVRQNGGNVTSASMALRRVTRAHRRSGTGGQQLQLLPRLSWATAASPSRKTPPTERTTVSRPACAFRIAGA